MRRWTRDISKRLLPSLAQRLSTAILALAISLATAHPLAAQEGGADRRSPIVRQIYEAFEDQEYVKARDLIKRYLANAPNDSEMLYNLACAQCRLGDFDASASALHQAFQAGYRDFNHLRRDPDLAALREHPIYKTILEEADKAAAAASKSAVDRWRDTYGAEHYRYETDHEHRINYATALDETSHREMRDMLERQADQMIKSLFERPPDYDVLIAVPTPEDADKFFGGNDSVGGMYQHDLRRLVARDIGGSLRHEFFHVMHYGHMERLNQQHPLWVQEGLAALYEDYVLSKDGSIVFVPNDRQIIVKARAKAGKLAKWNELFKMSAHDFMDKAQPLYPQVRSIFEFVAEQGKLEQWYKTYVKNFDDDRTGSRAFEITFGKPLADIERQWRRWAYEQPEIDLQIRSDDAALGIRSGENLANDGVLITDVVPGSAAARAKLRVGDIIVSVDRQSTRSLMDLRRIIAVHEVGDQVEVRARRNGEYLTVMVTLRAMNGGV